MLVPYIITHQDPPPYEPPMWSTGTDVEIVEALRKHYDDEDNFDIREYWNWGDERTVHLSAMKASDSGDGWSWSGESHIEQDVKMVLLQDIPDNGFVGNDYKLVTPIGNHNFGAFFVGLKASVLEPGNMVNSADDDYYWSSSSRKVWCDNVFIKALPPALKGIFKQFKVPCNYTDSQVLVDDYFALPSEYEVFGSASGTPQNEGTRFEWYKDSLNRIQTVGKEYYGGTHDTDVALRTPRRSSWSASQVKNVETMHTNGTNNTLYPVDSPNWWTVYNDPAVLWFSPFGVI